MHGNLLDQDVRVWFDVKVPRPTVSREFIDRALREAVRD